MTDHNFDPDDLEALRALRGTRAAPDGRALRTPEGKGGARSFQLNARVRREIKQMVCAIARHHRCTIAEVIECAIAQFYPAAMKAKDLRGPGDSET
jgi:hypothetical protein